MKICSQHSSARSCTRREEELKRRLRRKRSLGVYMCTYTLGCVVPNPSSKRMDDFSSEAATRTTLLPYALTRHGVEEIYGVSYFYGAFVSITLTLWGNLFCKLVELYKSCEFIHHSDIQALLKDECEFNNYEYSYFTTQ